MKPVIFFTDKTMTVIHQGSTEFIDLDTALGKECLELYQKGKHLEILDVVAASKLLGGSVEEGENGRLIVDGVEMDIELANKVREFKQQKLPFDYLLELAAKIDQIDSKHIRTQLYGFLKHNGHPITKDGNFIAYKMVSDDFKDLHTRTMDNNVGAVVTMPRRDCDDDPTRTCSTGLHVAAYDYAHKFGSGYLVLCEVDPRDVVAVPIDYDQKKMRTCRYKVVGLGEKPIEEAVFGYGNIDLVRVGDHIQTLDGMEYQIIRDLGYGNFEVMVTYGEEEGEFDELNLETVDFDFI